MGTTLRRFVRLTVTLTLLTLGIGTGLRLTPSSVGQAFEPAASLNDSAGSELGPLNRIDFFNHDVTRAVATYKLDPFGLLDEEHSPQTEIARLGEPKT